MTEMAIGDVEAAGRIFAQFTSPGGEATGPQIEIPLDLNTRCVESKSEREREREKEQESERERERASEREREIEKERARESERELCGVRVGVGVSGVVYAARRVGCGVWGSGFGVWGSGFRVGKPGHHRRWVIGTTPTLWPINPNRIPQNRHHYPSPRNPTPHTPNT